MNPEIQDTFLWMRTGCPCPAKDLVSKWNLSLTEVRKAWKDIASKGFDLVTPQTVDELVLACRATAESYEEEAKIIEETLARPELDIKSIEPTDKQIIKMIIAYRNKNIKKIDRCRAKSAQLIQLAQKTKAAKASADKTYQAK